MNRYISPESPASMMFAAWMQGVFQDLKPDFYTNDHDHDMCADLMRFIYGYGQ